MHGKQGVMSSSTVHAFKTENEERRRKLYASFLSQVETKKFLHTFFAQFIVHTFIR